MSRRGVARLAGLALAVLVALSASGCVAAGLATGPLMSAVQLVGHRSVERTVAADVADTVGATEAVLARMAFRIEHRERQEGVRRLRAVADEVTVHVKIERVTGTLTRLGLRVESGGFTADRDTGAQIHEQVAAALTPAITRASAAEPGAAEALSALRGEIRKLRSDIEERRATERPVQAAEPSSGVRLEPGAIVTVPMSAAVPTVGGPAPSVAVALPAPAVAPVGVAEHETPAREAAAAPLGVRTQAPLRPAAALTPIAPTRGDASGN
jgi:hypothetical protein